MTDDIDEIELPIIPDDDSDFSPDLARKIIAKYQAIVEQLKAERDAERRHSQNCTLAMVRANDQALEAMARAEAVLEEAAKVADPWPGFWPQDEATETDMAIIKVRTEIAKKIRALKTAQDKS